MDIEQVRIFISVVESGSFTKAAEALYISHSTTSRNVSALEERLNTRLLLRDSRQLRLTEAGSVLYREGKRLLEQIAALEEAVSKAAVTAAGSLSLVGVSMNSAELRAVYGEFCAKHPGTVLEIYKGGLSEVINLVEGGREDIGLAFSYAMPGDKGDFCRRSLARERFYLVCAEDDPLAGRGSVRAADLNGKTYLSVGEQRSAFARELEERLFAHTPDSEVVKVPSLEALFLQVRGGNGISLAPGPLARELGEGCALLEVSDLDAGFDLVVFWRKDNRNPSLPLFARLLDGAEEKCETDEA